MLRSCLACLAAAAAAAAPAAAPAAAAAAVTAAATDISYVYVQRCRSFTSCTAVLITYHMNTSYASPTYY